MATKPKKKTARKRSYPTATEAEAALRKSINPPPAWSTGDIVELAPKYRDAPLISTGSHWRAVVLSVAEKAPDDPCQYLLIQGISTTGIPWRSVVPAFMLVKAPNQP